MSTSSLLQLENVSKVFRVQGKKLHAVENVSFSVDAGKTFGLVGESGSGKSTLGRVALRLLEADAGRVVFQGLDLGKLPQKKIRAMRQDMQIIFQDPQASLNPRMTVGASIEDALIIHHLGTSAERQHRVQEVMERVGLPRQAMYAFPHELSGGQLQRVGIARALSVRPKLLVCDEPVSALDVSIQVQVLQLLRDLQQEMNLAYIFISHNLAVVEYLSDNVAVLYLGEVVEQAPAENLFQHPAHPYTQVLLQSILKTPEAGQEQQLLNRITGEMPSPYNPPPGCPFHPRCAIVQDICKTTKPDLRSITQGSIVACHFAQ